jgi:protein phosphatase
MKLLIPDPALVLLIGASGSGKSTFARRHFKPTEILSSDHLRGMLADDESNQRINHDVFEVLHLITAKRLSIGKLTVIDATSVQAEARKPLLTIAKQNQVPPIAIVFNIPEAICLARNLQRSGRIVESGIIAQQQDDLRQSLPALPREGFHHICLFDSPAETELAIIERIPL